jgi:hypothetical protein
MERRRGNGTGLILSLSIQPRECLYSIASDYPFGRKLRAILGRFLSTVLAAACRQLRIVQAPVYFVPVYRYFGRCGDA